MTDVIVIADRHLRAASGLGEADANNAQSVRIVVDRRWASSASGQLITACLVNLLCRQAKVIKWVEVVADETSLLVNLPSGPTTDPFPKCLEGMSVWATNGIVPARASTGVDADYTVIVGGKDTQRPEGGGYELFAVGDGWRAWIGEARFAPASPEPTSANPLGPFLAAALASGEIFKRSRTIQRGRYLTGDGFSLWDGQSAAEWDSLCDGPEITGLSLPPIHVIGVGAVGNGLAYVIANAQLNDAYPILIDDDTYDGTNLNRCFMAGWEDIGDPKPYAAARGLKDAGVLSYPFNHSINEYLVDPRSELRADAALEADNLAFKIVVSCVDKGISRQHVQGLWPELLLGGSTLDLRAQSNVYGLWEGSACLACRNPAEKDGEKLRSLERDLIDMPPDAREKFLHDRGLDAKAVEEYLKRNPDCGSIGEAALRDFATKPPTDFSVGFVSLGAALLLSSALFRHVFFPGTARDRIDMTTLNFLHGGLADSGLSYDESCEMNCQSRRNAATANSA